MDRAAGEFQQPRELEDRLQRIERRLTSLEGAEKPRPGPSGPRTETPEPNPGGPRPSVEFRATGGVWE